MHIKFKIFPKTTQNCKLKEEQLKKNFAIKILKCFLEEVRQTEIKTIVLKNHINIYF